MSKQLDEPILDRGILNTNFFNGRLLTAEDLKADQDANRLHQKQVGRAIGDGVICGLEVRLVSPGSITSLPVVSVSAGMALNRNGHVLTLPDNEEVSLTRRVDLAPPEVGIFSDCDAATSTVTSLANGLYVLVIGPVSGFKDRAPAQALRVVDQIAGCGSRWAAEGVQFRLVRFRVDLMPTIGAQTRTDIAALIDRVDAPSLSKLRNMMAHLCFGTEELSNLYREPFKQTEGHSAYLSYGAFDFMRARGDITNCEVPLAMVHWGGGLVRFLDLWSSRRRVTRGATSETTSPPLLDDRRASEGEAVIKQFQEHVEDLRARSSFPELAIAMNHFRYLPPAAILPIKQGAQKGFSLNTFFAGIVHRLPEFIDGSVLRTLFREAVSYEPIDLASGEMIWLYKVWQNERVPAGGTPAPPFVVFASPHVPYKATARFDVSRWEFSNYTRIED